jgi:hypothetical protein
MLPPSASPRSSLRTNVNCPGWADGSENAIGGERATTARDASAGARIWRVARLNPTASKL